MRIRFFHPNRKLAGFLLARGDGQEPYTVVMRRWGTITGRFVDSSGKPLVSDQNASGKASPSLNLYASPLWDRKDFNDATLGELPSSRVDAEHRFWVEGCVPGQRYSARIYHQFASRGTAFENLILQPGETHDLGDVRLEPPTPSKATVTPPGG
ncbi:MAG: hypothetical protein U0794_00710 [Isosphaeraceae bacterium]